MTDELLIERIRGAMHADVEGLQPPPELLDRVLAIRPRRRLGLSWLAPALAVAVAAIVAVVAVTSLGHRHAPARVPASAVPVAARRLVSRLAVLRRPQTPADVLPHWAVRETESLSDHAKLITGLSRLVGAVHMGEYGHARVYVVVETPPRFPVHRKRPVLPVLSPRLGDVALIAFVGPFREEAAINGPTVAAGADQVAATSHGLTVDPGQVSDLWGAVATIVPDGVVRVKWVFTGPGSGSSPVTVWPKVRANVALGRLAPARELSLTRVIWYGRDGRVISPYGAVTRQMHEIGRTAIAPSLSALFGVLRAHPPAPAQITAVPENSAGGSGMGLDYAQARFVPYPGAPTLRGQPRGLWVVGGSHGIALLSDGLNLGTSCKLAWASCSPSANPGKGAFLIGTTGYANGRQNIQGLVPDGNATVTVELADGARLRAPVIDNVFSITVPRGAVALIDKNAAGQMVRFRLS